MGVITTDDIDGGDVDSTVTHLEKFSRANLKRTTYEHANKYACMRVHEQGHLSSLAAESHPSSAFTFALRLMFWYA